MFNTIEAALADLKAGKVIIVCDDEDRENEGDFVSLAATATPEVINFMAKYGRGLICTPIEADLARKLELMPMVGHNTDPHGTAFTVSIDYKTTTTGISAFERSETILRLLDETTTASDYKRPGHVFPLVAKDGGVLRRAGHTEAAVDLAKLAGSFPAGVICEIMNEDGTMARVPDLRRIADEHNLQMITIQDLIAYRNRTETFIKREVDISLPTAFGDFRVVGYSNTLDDKEHIAFVKGEVDEQPLLVRVHSECLLGDTFHSLRCDCGAQLHAALRQIEAEGRGVLLYMRQEGRGLGLLNKLKSYEAENQSEAKRDLREYGIGAQILRDLGVRRMKLMTNNPRKIAGVSGYQLQVVEQVPLHVLQGHQDEILGTLFQK